MNPTKILRGMVVFGSIGLIAGGIFDGAKLTSRGLVFVRAFRAKLRRDRLEEHILRTKTRQPIGQRE